MAEWQLGIQAGVIALFDIDAESKDLINADYWVGFPITYRKERMSGLLRIYHQSSHLGDEYILRNRVDRVNLSYEGIEAKISYDLKRWLRLYAGTGYLFRTEPEDLKPWSTQSGIELRGREISAFKVLTPVAGADFKSRQESNWNVDISLRVGVEFEVRTSRDIISMLQIMLEYFNGHSPNGQFYERPVEYIGIGTHFYF
jgi:hypothetical protein